MPAAIAAAVVSAVGATGVAATVLSFAVSTAASLAFSFVAKALAPKPKKPNLSSFQSQKTRGYTQQFRQPVAPRQSVYGEARVSGAILYAGVTSNNKYLHFVVSLASHEVEEIGEIYINEESIPPDAINGSGNVTSGRYANKIRIEKFLGSDSQAASANLVSEITDWTTNHRLKGIAYVYVRFQWDRDIYQSGIPNISAWVKGKKITDPRDATEKWTPNAALLTYSYLTDTRLGINAATSTVDETILNASANTCEEFVPTTSKNFTIDSVDTATDIFTLDGDILEIQTGDMVEITSGTFGGVTTGGDYYAIVYQRKDTPRIKLATTLENALNGVAVDVTSGTTGIIVKTAEPRYFGGGAIDTDSDRAENMKDFASGMAGQVIYVGGEWKIFAGEYQTPTIYFDQDDLAGEIEVVASVSIKDRFNTVIGVYISQINDGNPSDYPVVTNSTYVSTDGGEIRRNLDLPFTQRPHTAQRIAKIALERTRQELIFTARFKLTAFKVQPNDNLYFTFAKYGFDEKVFEVISWKLSSSEGTPYIEMVCRENDSTVYDWNNGEETAVDPAPNTNLPDSFVVEVVTGFSLDSVAVFTQDQDRVYNVLAGWELSDNEYVLSGGRYEIVYKETTETAYKSVGFVDGSINELRVTALQPDVLYDVQIYAYNSLGQRSAATTINNFLVGTTVTTLTEDWETETVDRDGDDWENDGLTSEDWES